MKCPIILNFQTQTFYFGVNGGLPHSRASQLLFSVVLTSVSITVRASFKMFSVRQIIVRVLTQAYTC